MKEIKRVIYVAKSHLSFCPESFYTWIFVGGGGGGGGGNHTLTFLYFHSSKANIVIMSFELFYKCTKVYFKNTAFTENNNNGAWGEQTEKDLTNLPWVLPTPLKKYSACIPLLQGSTGSSGGMMT